MEGVEGAEGAVQQEGSLKNVLQQDPGPVMEAGWRLRLDAMESMLEAQVPKSLQLESQAGGFEAET